tara:strand:- start:420 stop:1436 length:1017 start_codon:yes stop_codon:yes gene_type:complete
MGSTKVKMPAQRSGSEEMRSVLSAQAEFAPKFLELAKEMNPQYAQLEMDTLKKNLPQLMQMYSQHVFPQMMQQEQAKMAQDISNVEQFGGRAREAFKAANPEQAKLMESLSQQAQEGLDAGASLDPSLRREVQQNIRAGQAARGMGMGMGDLAAEATMTGLQAEQLRRQRQAFAGNVVSLQKSTGMDPFMAILGRPSQMAGMAQGFGQQGMGVNAAAAAKTPQWGMNNYFQDLFNTNYNAQVNASMANASNNASMLGAGIGAVGKIGAAAIPFCWVAREVYGADNPRWLMFREWMLNDSPSWLFKLYLKYGERFANWLKGNGWLKPAIRKFMDSKIGD